MQILRVHENSKNRAKGWHVRRCGIRRFCDPGDDPDLVDTDEDVSIRIRLQ